MISFIEDFWDNVGKPLAIVAGVLIFISTILGNAYDRGYDAGREYLWDNCQVLGDGTLFKCN